MVRKRASIFHTALRILESKLLWFNFYAMRMLLGNFSQGCLGVKRLKLQGHFLLELHQVVLLLLFFLHVAQIDRRCTVRI